MNTLYIAPPHTIVNNLCIFYLLLHGSETVDIDHDSRGPVLHSHLPDVRHISTAPDRLLLRVIIHCDHLGSAKGGNNSFFFIFNFLLHNSESGQSVDESDSFVQLPLGVFEFRGRELAPSNLRANQ